MKHQITVVPIGPGSPSLLTLHAADLLRSGKQILFRTARHPVAAWLQAQQIPFSSLDELYEAAEDFDSMNAAIVQAVLRHARAGGEVLYAVPDPGSDQTVTLLLREAAGAGCAACVLPGVSLANSALAACRGSFEQPSVQTVSAADFSAFPWDPSVNLLITELDSMLLAGEVKLRLSEYLDDLCEVQLLPASEAEQRPCKTIPLCDLDRQKHYDQTVSLFIPGRNALRRARFCFNDLLQITRGLRSRQACPADAQQAHQSLLPTLSQQVHQAAEAIDTGESDSLVDALGAILFQVVCHAAIGADFDEFTLTDVISKLCSQLRLQHPDAL